MYQPFVTSYNWIIFLCVDIPHFVYPFSQGGVLGLFPNFCRLWTMYEPTCTNFWGPGHSPLGRLPGSVGAGPEGNSVFCFFWGPANYLLHRDSTFCSQVLALSPIDAIFNFVLRKRWLQKQKVALEFPEAGVKISSKLTSPCFKYNRKHEMLRAVFFLIPFLCLIGEQLRERLNTFVLSSNSLEKAEMLGKRPAEGRLEAEGTMHVARC